MNTTNEHYIEFNSGSVGFDLSVMPGNKGITVISGIEFSDVKDKYALYKDFNDYLLNDYSGSGLRWMYGSEDDEAKTALNRCILMIVGTVVEEVPPNHAHPDHSPSPWTFCVTSRWKVGATATDPNSGHTIEVFTWDKSYTCSRNC